MTSLVPINVPNMATPVSVSAGGFDKIAVLPGGIYFGTYPDPETLSVVLAQDVTVIVDLTEPKDQVPVYTVPPTVEYIKAPTPDRGTLPDAETVALVRLLGRKVFHEHKKVYIHCRGGSGRSAVIAACLYGYLTNCGGTAALAYVYQAHQQRRVLDPKWRRMGAPQTTQQKAQVIRLLAPYDFYSSTSSFSNFSPHPVYSTTFGMTFHTSEALFQAYKAPSDREYVARQAACVSPKQAKALGRKCVLRSDWEAVKVQCMCQTVMDKITAHPAIKNELFQTKLLTMYEHTTNDREWGDGGDRTGRNLLGSVWAWCRVAAD